MRSPTLNRFGTVLLLAGAVVVTSASSATGAALASITPKASVSVSGLTLTIGDIASVSGKDQALVTRIKAVSAGNAPWPGQKLVIDAGQIAMRLKQARIDPAQVTVATGTRAVVERASQEVTGIEIAEVAKSTLTDSWQAVGRMECEVAKIPPDVVVPAGSLELSATVTASRPGVHTVPVYINVDGIRQRAVGVSLRVRCFQPVLVTTRAIARGEEVADGDVAVEEREVANVSQTPSQADPSRIEGTKASRALAAGAIVRDSDLDVIPLVRRNSPVVLIATSGRATVRSTAVAMEDGLLGQIVKVKPDYTTQSVSARVSGDGRVEIGI